ncbi:MAG: hypothetical protein AAFQ04_08090 [Pseudomonadota bacterium]
MLVLKGAGVRDIVLWDRILNQLQSGAYGTAPSYGQVLELEGPSCAEIDPSTDLDVPWDELEYNLALMHEDEIITADFSHRAISNVQLTERGRRLSDLNDEIERHSHPVRHMAKRINTFAPLFALPLFGLGLAALFALGAF